jgi:hypothetical protein
MEIGESADTRNLDRLNESGGLAGCKFLALCLRDFADPDHRSRNYSSVASLRLKRILVPGSPGEIHTFNSPLEDKVSAFLIGGVFLVKEQISY